MGEAELSEGRGYTWEGLREGAGLLLVVGAGLIGGGGGL